MSFASQRSAMAMRELSPGSKWNKTAATRAPLSLRSWHTGLRTKEGRQRQDLQAWLTRLVDALQGRVYGFNVSVAHVWADQERLFEKPVSARL